MRMLLRIRHFKTLEILQKIKYETNVTNQIKKTRFKEIIQLKRFDLEFYNYTSI